MAQEISVTITASITLSSQAVSGTTNYKADLAGDYIGQEQDIGTSAEAIDFGADISSPKIAYIRNMDATNYVEIDSANTFDKFPQKLLPGEAILLKPETATIYAKANTATVKIFFICG